LLPSFYPDDGNPNPTTKVIDRMVGDGIKVGTLAALTSMIINGIALPAHELKSV
jgi:hypothetical protein